MKEYWYPQWRKERGEPIEVYKIRFMSYLNKNNRRYIFSNPDSPIRYCCEIWLCQLPDGHAEL